VPVAEASKKVLYDKKVSESIDLIMVEHQLSAWQKWVVFRQRYFSVDQQGKRAAGGWVCFHKIHELDSPEAVENTLNQFQELLDDITAVRQAGLNFNVTSTGRLENFGLILEKEIMRNSQDQNNRYFRPVQWKCNLKGDDWLTFGMGTIQKPEETISEIIDVLRQLKDQA
jgi:hypothetical protein